jgi:hypothetical protein
VTAVYNFIIASIGRVRVSQAQHGGDGGVKHKIWSRWIQIVLPFAHVFVLLLQVGAT